MLTFEAVEAALDLCLVACIETGRDTVRRPRLVDAAVLWTRRVGAQRGRVDDRPDSGLGGGAEDAGAPLDVYAPEQIAVVSGLDQPGEVDGGVGAAEETREVRVHDVGRNPFGLRLLERGTTARDPDDRLDLGLVRERAEQAGSDVPGGADDSDPHTELIPLREAS